MDFETAHEITRTLRSLTLTQRAYKASLLRRLDLKLGQEVILVELAGVKSASQVELAEVSEVDNPSVGRSIARLEDKGLVTRSVDPDDARRRVVELTPAGLALVPKIKEIYVEFAKKAVGETDGPFQQRLLKTAAEATARFKS
jgi:DNA-binding MarR family transcriptional regulator